MWQGESSGHDYLCRLWRNCRFIASQRSTDSGRPQSALSASRPKCPIRSKSPFCTNGSKAAGSKTNGSKAANNLSPNLNKAIKHARFERRVHG
jgi:hypothetical protein